MEAKYSVDRLYDLVEKHYQAMSLRVHMLELNGLNETSQGHTLFSECKDLSQSTSPSSFGQIIHSNPNAASDLATSDFQTELENSKVYRNVSGTRMSIFSVDQQTIALSCFSSLSLSEVSNLSVINLAVTKQDLYNPERLSQSWSDHQTDLPRSLQTSLEGNTPRIHPDIQSANRQYSPPLETEPLIIDIASRNPKDVDWSSISSELLPPGWYVRTLYDFNNPDDKEALSFQEADTIEVIMQLANGW